MESKELTIVIVTFKSEKKIIKCLKSISSEISVIVVENSNNLDLKKKIENNFNELISQNNFNLNNHAKVAIKASKQDFSDKNRKVFGTLYELIGPVASPSQFYVTDSIDNFLAGTLFFKIKPIPLKINFIMLSK